MGIPAGLYTAFHRGRWADHVVRIVSLFGFSIPTYFLGLLMLLVFFATLDWAPPGMGRLSLMLTPPPDVTGSYLIDGLIARDWEVVYSAAAQMVLPVLSVAIICRRARSSSRCGRSSWTCWAATTCATPTPKGLPGRRVWRIALAHGRGADHHLHLR